MNGLRDLLSHIWTRGIGLDTRLKNSAVATIFLSIVTGLLIGLPGYFQGDAQAKVPEANITRAMYETKLVEEACYYDKFIALEKKTLMAIEPMTLAPTPENFVAALGGYVDFARSARPVVADMQKTMQGVVPPQELREDHEKLESSLQVLGKIVDDLDRSLPTGLNRPPAELLADPKVIDNILTSTRIITGMANTLGSTRYSGEFVQLMTCPDLNTPLAPVR
jgi:hypothetical protein